MTTPEQIVAIGLLTRRDLDRLGASFARAYRVQDAPCYGELLSAIDEADRQFHREADVRRAAAVDTIND